jgi:hypothetical protein
MPIFGQAVRDGVRPDVQEAIDRQWEGYACGQYGPDPLFFYHMGLPSSVVRQGHALHYLEPVGCLERLRGPIQAGVPYALAYGLGFLCHFMLDSGCHPYIRSVSQQREISHLAMEGEFDRYLMKEAGYIPHKHTPLARPEDTAVYAAAALAYENVTPQQFHSGMRGYYLVSRSLTRFQGSVFCPAVDVVTRPIESSHKVLLRKHPAKASLVTTPKIMADFQAAVPRTIPLVEQLYDAYWNNAPIDFLPKENFQGQAME